MNCPSCQTPNEETASYCRSCGAVLKYTYAPAPYNTTNSNSDTLILVVVIFMVISALYWAILPKVIDDWWETMKIPSAILRLIWGVVPLTLAFAVRDKTMKIVLIIIGALYLIHAIYQNVIEFI